MRVQKVCDEIHKNLTVIRDTLAPKYRMIVHDPLIHGGKMYLKVIIVGRESGALVASCAETYSIDEVETASARNPELWAAKVAAEITTEVINAYEEQQMEEDKYVGR
jgi:hypothetical protein